MFRKSSVLVVLSLILNAAVNCHAFNSDELMAYLPEPRLKEPRGEVIDLTGKDEIRFSWDKHIGKKGTGKYYDLRIYRGTELLESALIFKEKIPGSFSELYVPAYIFGDNGFYTWSLRMGYRSYGKSSRAIRTFQIIKS